MKNIVKPELILNEGEIYTGIILGKNEQSDDRLPGESGHADYHLIILPDEVEKVKWQHAIEWAKSIGGSLPTLRELSLAYINASQHFKKGTNFYWSCEQHKSTCYQAMCQCFENGYDLAPVIRTS